MTIAEIYELPTLTARRRAMRRWYEQVGEERAWSGRSTEPSDDVIDSLLEAERLRRQIVGRAA